MKRKFICIILVSFFIFNIAASSTTGKSLNNSDFTKINFDENWGDYVLPWDIFDSPETEAQTLFYNLDRNRCSNNKLGLLDFLENIEKKDSSDMHLSIDPEYFKTWDCDEFEGVKGHRSTIYNNHIYVSAYMYEDLGNHNKNYHTAILKYDTNSGELVTSKILYSEKSEVPLDIVEYNGQIYLLCGDKFGYGSHWVFYKLDADMNDLICKKIDRTGYTYLSPHRLISSDYGLYLTGECRIGNKPLDIFLAIFDEDLNPVWNSYTIWDSGENDPMDIGALAIHEDFIYIGGSEFILKYTKDGEFIKSVIVPSSKWITAIEAQGDTIYVASMILLPPLKNDILVSAYDNELNLKWSKSFNEGLLEQPDDMIVKDNHIYLCGVVADPGINHRWSKINGFVLKLDIISHKKVWFKEIEECEGSEAWSINDKNNHLFLSGQTTNLDETESGVFVMKCTTDWGKSRFFDSPFFDFINNNSKIFSFLNHLLKLFEKH